MEKFKEYDVIDYYITKVIFRLNFIRNEENECNEGSFSDSDFIEIIDLLLKLRSLLQK